MEMNSLIVKSDPVIMKDGGILTIPAANGMGQALPGGPVRNGESLEEACINRAKERGINIAIKKPLHPTIIKRKNSKGEVITLVSINYSAELVN
jgi:ADP-ribose pyrophosphatase YjhB (NUDIX family)